VLKYQKATKNIRSHKQHEVTEGRQNRNKTMTMDQKATGEDKKTGATDEKTDDKTMLYG